MFDAEFPNMSSTVSRRGSFGSLGDLTGPNKRIRSGSISGRLRFGKNEEVKADLLGLNPVSSK
jgi:hypothetical protein